MTEAELAKLLKGNPDLHMVDDGTRTYLPPIVDNGDRSSLPPIRDNGARNKLPSIRRVSEHDMQKSIIDECNLRANQNPDWGMTFAVPNGGERHVVVAQMLKAEGVRPGVPDLFNLTPRHGFHGLVMEVKVSPNDVTAEQLYWLLWFAAHGFCAVIVRDDAAVAINLLNWYLEGKEECSHSPASSLKPLPSLYLTYVTA